VPKKDEHIDQAKHNRSFWDSFSIDKTKYLDWVVVGMFYEAIHWIEAYLATKKHHSKNHYEREQQIAKTPELAEDPNLILDYGTLRVESENARYWYHKHTPDQVTSDLIPLITRLRRTMEKLL